VTSSPVSLLLTAVKLSLMSSVTVAD
jgi:hypothetical protein